MTQIDKSKSMRRQRARLRIRYPEGSCWALVTCSPVPSEQGSCVGQVGFLVRLCPRVAEEMPATPPHAPSHTHALIRATLTLVLAHRVTRWVRAAEWAGSGAVFLSTAAYRRGLGLCSADETSPRGAQHSRWSCVSGLSNTTCYGWALQETHNLPTEASRNNPQRHWGAES